MKEVWRIPCAGSLTDVVAGLQQTDAGVLKVTKTTGQSLVSDIKPWVGGIYETFFRGLFSHDVSSAFSGHQLWLTDPCSLFPIHWT